MFVYPTEKLFLKRIFSAKNTSPKQCPLKRQHRQRVLSLNCRGKPASPSAPAATPAPFHCDSRTLSLRLIRVPPYQRPMIILILLWNSERTAGRFYFNEPLPRCHGTARKRSDLHFPSAAKEKRTAWQWQLSALKCVPRVRHGCVCV